MSVTGQPQAQPMGTGCPGPPWVVRRTVETGSIPGLQTTVPEVSAFHSGLRENCVLIEFGFQIPGETFSGLLLHSRLGARCPIKAEPPAWTSVLLIPEILSEPAGGEVFLDP